MMRYVVLFLPSFVSSHGGICATVDVEVFYYVEHASVEVFACFCAQHQEGRMQKDPLMHISAAVEFSSPVRQGPCMEVICCFHVITVRRTEYVSPLS